MACTPGAFAPTNLFYLVSLRCNERCTKCSHWRVREHPYMIEARLVVEAVRGIPSAIQLCIVGGEPLVYRNLVLEVLTGLADLSICTTIVTNGVLCTPEFVERVRGLGVHLVFSIDTLDQQRWQWVRGKDSMKQVLDNLAYVRATLRPEQVSIQSVLAQETVADVAVVAEWCREQGIYHSVQRYVQGGFDGSWTPLPDDTAVLTNAIAAPNGSCAASGRNLSIMPDGRVYTCFQQPWINGCKSPLGKLGVIPIQAMLTSQYAAEVVDGMTRCDLPCKVLKCNQ
ncbi:MAG: radical SAM protein [Calditrichaeota bacterium]|nr:radical SAM protein [Calditrichota bacterium]